MKKTQHQDGFSAIEAILLLIVILLIGFIGYYVYHAKQEADKNLDVPASTAQAASKKVATEAATTTSATATTRDFSFKYPNDWKTTSVSMNGVTIQSPDYATKPKDEDNVTTTAGSQITVYVDSALKGSLEDNIPTDSGTLDNQKMITVAGQSALEGTQKYPGYGQNSTLVVFIKDGKRYVIDMSYSLDSTNPYQSVLDAVKNSLALL